MNLAKHESSRVTSTSKPGFQRALFRASLAALLGCFLAGCSSVGPGTHFGNVPLSSLKTAYVVLDQHQDAQVGQCIKDAVNRHGIIVSSGSMNDKPADVDFYALYTGQWRWDLSMYLFALDIHFMDNKTGQPIAKSMFRQGAFHSFPDRCTKSAEVVESIFAAK